MSALTFIDDSILADIANALREKTGSELSMKPSEMPIILQGLDVIKSDITSLMDRSITSYTSPDVTKIREYGLCYCTGLHTVSLENCTVIENHAFYMDRSLKNLSFPKVTTIGESAFSGCEHIVTITLPKVTSIGNYAFFTCSRLEELVLSNNVVCTLANADALAGTLIAESETNGYIKVPSNLVASYKAANGWSTYANKIIAI